MKAWVLSAIADPNGFNYTDVPDPVPGPGQVVIDVRAAGVNFADWLLVNGKYLTQTPLPMTPGSEVAGVISEVGDGVDPSRVGQRVLARSGGAYAERAICKAEAAMPIPDNLNFAAAAAFPVVSLTAWHALVTFGRCQPGERVLVHAAAGGVGTAAVQIAKARGLWVVGTASNQEKLDRVRQLGADATVNYATTDFAQGVMDLTGGEGVDIVLEMVGGDTFAKSLAVLRMFGRLVNYGAAGGERGQVDTATLMSKNLTVSGLWLGGMRDPKLNQQAFTELLQLVEEGSLQPQVGHILNLSQAKEAHALMATRANYGKIVLVP